MDCVYTKNIQKSLHQNKFIQQYKKCLTSQAKEENNSHVINFAYYYTEIKFNNIVSKSQNWNDM